MTEQKYYMGWKNSLPDHRDLKLAVATPTTFPPRVDLRPQIDWVYNQAQEESCTAHAAASLTRFIMKKNNWPIIDPARNFIYWYTRLLEGDTDQDGGAYVRDAIKSVANYGVCDEKLWSYGKDTLFANPGPATTIKAALKNCASKYMQVDQSLNGLHSCLANEKVPFIFGMTLCQSFVDAPNGVIPIPDSTEKPIGSHCMCCVGYDVPSNYYIVLNSWGKEWGNFGYCFIPYEMLHSNDYSDDFWMIESLVAKNA